MEREYTDEQLREQIIRNSKAAEKLLSDTDKMEQFLRRLEEKLKKIPAPCVPRHQSGNKSGRCVK